MELNPLSAELKKIQLLFQCGHNFANCCFSISFLVGVKCMEKSVPKGYSFDQQLRSR